MKKLSLALLPPGCVSSEVTVDIRYAARPDGAMPTLQIGDETPIVLDQPSGVYRRRFQTSSEVVLTQEGESVSRQIEVLRRPVRSTGLISGAWCGLYHWSEKEGRLWNKELREFDAGDWAALVRAMHDVGMDTIVIQELFRNEEYFGKHRIPQEGYHGRAFYPSKLVDGRMPIRCPDPAEAIFAEADRLGMSVLPGIGMYAWFDFTGDSLRWHREVAREVYHRYGHHKSFYGWYISEEVYGNMNYGPDTAKDIVAFFHGFRQLRDELDPVMPIMLAPNCFEVPLSLNAWHLLARELDIICPFGFHRMPEQDLTAEQAIALFQEIADSNGAHLWMDMESFLFDAQMALYPRPIDDIIGEIQRFSSFEKVLCYQFPGLMNARDAAKTPGGAATVQLYESYTRYYRQQLAEQCQCGVCK